MSTANAAANNSATSRTVNEFSLYYTDTNALDVSVNVSATYAAIQTTTLQKDADGAETAD